MNSDGRLTVFTYQDKVKIRTFIDKSDGSVWFCLVDVCQVLDIKDPSSVSKRLKVSQKRIITKSEMKGQLDMRTPSSWSHSTFINEPAIYKVAFSSRKKEAERFQDWVCEDVIPSVRKRGFYSLSGEMVSSLDFPVSLSVYENQIHQNKKANAILSEKISKKHKKGTKSYGGAMVRSCGYHHNKIHKALHGRTADEIKKQYGVKGKSAIQILREKEPVISSMYAGVQYALNNFETDFDEAIGVMKSSEKLIAYVQEKTDLKPSEPLLTE